MEFIDLSRELFHRTQTHPSHPPVIVTVWGDHSEQKVAGNTVFTSKALSPACWPLRLVLAQPLLVQTLYMWGKTRLRIWWEFASC